MNAPQDDRPDLAFVQTSDLVKELGRRFDHFAWCGDAKRTSKSYTMEHGMHSPDLLHVIGMLEHVKQLALAQLSQQLTHLSQDGFFDD